ncbi:hypothetical protein [Streptomyces subrutilus]
MAAAASPPTPQDRLVQSSAPTSGTSAEIRQYSSGRQDGTGTYTLTGV